MHAAKTELQMRSHFCPRFSLSISALIFACCFPAVTTAQTRATTENGKAVLLHEDGSWEYASENEETSKDQTAPEERSKKESSGSKNRSKHIELPETEGAPKYSHFLSKKEQSEEFEQLKPTLGKYANRVASTFPMKALRQQEGACRHGSLGGSGNVSMTTCLIKGRPKTLNDDKKPRLRVIVESNDIDLAKPSMYQLSLTKNGTELLKSRMEGPSPETSESGFYSIYEKVLSDDFEKGDDFRVNYVAAYNTELTQEDQLHLRSVEKWKEVSRRSTLSSVNSKLKCSKARPAEGVEYHLCTAPDENRVHVLSMCKGSLCPLWRTPGALSVNEEVLARWDSMSVMDKIPIEQRTQTYVPGTSWSYHYMALQTDKKIRTVALRIEKSDVSTNDYWPIKLRVSAD